MKKIISFYKRHLPDSQFVVLLLLMACTGFSLFFGFVALGAVSALLLVCFLLSTVKTEKTQGPFCELAEGDDPLPEPAEKLPYVYYDKPVEQKAHTIRYYSPYLGLEREIKYRPRKSRGKPFDNVRGIKVTDRLILLRTILFTSHFPDDIREMAKQHEGRFPNEAEIKQIYAKFNEINQNLYECGEPLLQRQKYLYTSGNEDADESMNYCLDFANGEKTFTDCDSFVCAVLIERLPLDAKKLQAELKVFQNKSQNQSDLKDEFDVLCLVNDQKVRLPFSKRNMGEVIGIFPFSEEPEYLELDEVENKKHTDKDVDESRLLDEHFCCACVSLVVDRLNRYLKELGKPILKGSYLADSSYMQGCGWIIGFNNTGDYHGGSVPAKLRYMGRFYGTCQK